MARTYLMGILALSTASAAGSPARAQGPVTTVIFGDEAEDAAADPDATATEPGREAEPGAGPGPGPGPGAGTATGAGPAAEPCPPAVTVVRRMGGAREREHMPLIDCAGHVRDEALTAVSVLARPRQMEDPPTEAELEAWRRRDRTRMVAEGIRRLHPGLLRRLQRIGEAFDGHPIELLSGYRPGAPETSRHHHGRALDLRVRDVDREAVRDLAVGLEHTGVGWYPNSVFVHVDVRTRSHYWVDASRPGEPPRYLAGATPPATTEPLDPGDSNEVPLTREDLDVLRRETARALAGLRVDAP